MKFNYLRFLFLIICFFPIRSFSQIPNFPLDTTIRVAGEFNLTDLNNEVVTSENLKGNIVVINFWGIKCKPCIQEIPQLNSLVLEFETKNVHFIGITSDSEYDLRIFLKEHRFDYKICPTPEYQKLMLDLVEMPAVPVHLIIDKNWKIVYRYIGALENEAFIQFKQTIDKLLKS